MATVVARYSSLRSHAHFRVDSDLELRVNDMVVLKTKRGLEMGQVKVPPGDHKLKPRESVAGEVVRKTTLDDSNSFREQRSESFIEIKRAFKRAAREHRLPMKYVNTERVLSGDRLIVYFTSEERVDFREFVRQFSDAIDSRVELRQVGARDAARINGDVGSCGQELCCISYIIDFVPVSMKMAKNQRISLDPAKISGQCGRLKCCLKYEDDLYVELRKTVPQEGQPVKCEGKDCHACNVDILGQKVTVDFGDGNREIVELDQIEFEKGWTDKDIRRYRKERRKKIREEREAKRQARDRRKSKRTEGSQRRQAKEYVHPGRRAEDQSDGNETPKRQSPDDKAKE